MNMDTLLNILNIVNITKGWREGMLLKSVVSVSLGASIRNHKVSKCIMNEDFNIERIGTDGDMDRAVELIKSLDGTVDAIGLGGIDLYLNAGNKKYIIKDARPLVEAAKVSPILDGTFVKNTLERKVIKYIRDRQILDFNHKKILMVCGLDRFGMAEALIESGGDVMFGDVMFSIGINFPIYSMKALHLAASVLAPIVCRMPFEMIYPTGKDQELRNNRFIKYFIENEIIAGDYLYIKKYMPDNMQGKVVITNTVTQKDVLELKQRGVKVLITTTPELQGRSFGTNVIEAVLTVISGKSSKDISEDDYSRLIDEIGLVPRVEYLNISKQYAID